MRDRAKTRASVQREPLVVPTVAELERTGVQSGADTDRDPLRPSLRGEGALELEGACQPLSGVGEDREQAVTLPLIGRQVSGMAEDGLDPELVVSSHRLAHLAGVLFPQYG